MKFKSDCLHVISLLKAQITLVRINYLLGLAALYLVVAIGISYSKLISVKQITTSNPNLIRLEDNYHAFQTSLNFLNKSIKKIFAQELSINIDRHSLKIVDKYDVSSVIAENLLEFEASYKNLVHTLNNLNQSNILGRVSYIQIKKKKDSPKLLVSLKTYHILKRDEI